MNSSSPIETSRPPDAYEKQLVSFFLEIEVKQIDFIDEAGKRLIELATILIGVILGIVAFGDKFPPDYIKFSLNIKILVITILIFYLAGIIMGAWAIYPRRYKQYKHNVVRMRDELDKIIRTKSRALIIGGSFFLIASMCLVILIALLILAA